MFYRLFVTFLFCVIIPQISLAVDPTEYEKDLDDLINTEIKIWSHNDIVIDAIKSQNIKYADISSSETKNLNNKWRSEKRKNEKPLTNRVLENDLSGYLYKIQEKGQGVYTEIIAVDNNGINVGQSILSSNYWQGKQPRWGKTFGARSYATYKSHLHFSDDTNMFQVEVSFMVVANEEPIGIIYAGVDIEQLRAWRKRQEE